jgi:hypothetical protein
MKHPSTTTTIPSGCCPSRGQRSARLLSLFAVSMLSIPASVQAASLPPLGSAVDFAVLGASTVTSTGATVVTGDLGVSPGSAVTGFPPGIVTGSTYTGVGSSAGPAQADALIAYNDADGQVCDTDLTGVDLGGLTLTPGVYCFDTSAQLTGTLTLDFLGDSTAVFIFQTGSTLTTGSNARVVAINGAPSCNKVTWQVGSSATLGTGTEFLGNVLALASITATTGASSDGSLYALNGAVTLDTSFVQACDGSAGPGPFVTPFVQVRKFCDANANGLRDPLESGISNWPITFTPDPNVCSGVTDLNGMLLCADLPVGTYDVSEGGKDGCLQTSTCVDGICGTCSTSAAPCGFDGDCDVDAGETCIANTPWNPVTVTLAADEHQLVEFGNTCLGAGGGKTLGFWSNRNGQKLIGADQLALLRSLNLVHANGTAFDPTTAEQVKMWLLNVKATNMAYMLSAQLAAMELNVQTGKVDGSELVFAGTAPVHCDIPGLSIAGFIRIDDLMADANAELAAPGNVTLAKNPERACQQFKSKALDAANSNKNFAVCPASF